MIHQPPSRGSELQRRRQVLIAGALGLLGILAPRFPYPAAAAGQFPQSIDALKKGVAAETAAHRRYVGFGQHAHSEGYRGLAYLYMALATSERIHAQNYTRVLATLGELIGEPETAPIETGTAQENLIYAAERELYSIEHTYPLLLQSVEDEGHADAIATVRYSWSSHRQHLAIIERIRRWTPGFFESVARKIDETTDRYFVCQVCGSTVTERPVDDCPVCGEAAANYRLIPDDRYS